MLTEKAQTLREMYDHHVKLVYSATRADIDFKGIVERQKAELDELAGKTRALISDAAQAQIAFEKAVLLTCEELGAPIGHSIDVFGDGTVKPAAACLNPDGTPRGKPQQ